MESPIVKINIDDANKIAQLYGVGEELANKIVKYRKSNGYFKNPEDLAKIKGISQRLAETLSPHIDWSTPSNPNEEHPTESPSLFLISFYIIIVGGILWVLNYGLNTVRYSIQAYHISPNYGWIRIWIALSFFAAMFFTLVMFLLMSFADLFIRNLAWHKKIKTVAYFFLGMMLFSLLLLGIGNVFRYQSVYGWNALLQNTPALIGLCSGISVFIISIPIFCVIWRPLLISNVLFTRFFDIAVLLQSIPELLLSMYLPETFPFYMRLFFVLMGVKDMYFGVTALRSDSSLIQYYVLPSLISSENKQEEHQSWLKWLNSRLPSPEHQQSLKKALNQAYPPSRLRTVTSVIVVGVGGWLILQSIGAVIQWIIGKGLDNIFR